MNYKKKQVSPNTHIYWWQLIQFNVFNHPDHLWSLWADVYRSRLDVISWKFEWWCHELLAFIEPMKQCNTADQLTHCLVSYCWCHSAIASCLLAMAVFSTGSFLEYHIYRDYDTELSEFPDDQRVIASHYAKIKDTELCEYVRFIQCTSLLM